MQSTMQDFPLTVTGILRHGTGWNSSRRVTTASADGYRDISYGELGTRVAQLAHGLRHLGVTDGDRVATFMWNNQEHLEAYFAAPCMGAVLHTLNIRLAGEQIAFIANQAEDRVVLVDMSLAPQLAAVLPEMTSVQTVVAVGEGDVASLTALRQDVVRYDDLLGRAADRVQIGPIWTKEAPPQCVTPAARPETRKAWCTATARVTCIRWRSVRPTELASSTATACYRSSRCSTRTRGASRTRP